MVNISGEQVEFSIRRPKAAQVFVAGDFTGWHRVPMHRRENGRWLVSLKVKPGEYGFRYVTDHEEWFTDFCSFGTKANSLGGLDSILFVPAGNPAADPHLCRHCGKHREGENFLGVVGSAAEREDEFALEPVM